LIKQWGPCTFYVMMLALLPSRVYNALLLVEDFASVSRVVRILPVELAPHVGGLNLILVLRSFQAQIPWLELSCWRLLSHRWRKARTIAPSAAGS